MFRDLKLYAGIKEWSDADVESQVLAAHVEPATGRREVFDRAA